MSKFTMTYGRTVRPAEFESTHIEVSQDYEQGISWDAAYQEVRGFVEAKVLEALTPPNGQPTTTPPPSPLPETPWRKSSRKPGLDWCPDDEATPEDVAKAKRNEAGMWYLPPREGYQHGSIFRRTPR